MIPHNIAQKAGFEIISAAPAGGSASIYKSRHIQTGQLCALKIPVDNANSRVVEVEAELLGRLDHSSIVRLFKSGTEQSACWLATHWVDGKQLAEFLKQGTLFNEQRARRLILQLASALQHAHECGVVHADISPANIIIDSDDSATIVDFGIGRKSDTATVTAGSDFTGTLRYVAPEVIQGRRASGAGDQYSIAVILYELLTGCWPYEGDSSAAAALHSHLYAEPVSVQERNPAVSSLMDEVLSKCLSKDPDGRFSSMTAFAEALSDGAYQRQLSGVGKSYRIPVRGHEPTIFKSIGKGMLAVGAVAVLSSVVWLQNLSSPDAGNTIVLAQSRVSDISNRCNLLDAPALDDAGLVKNFYGADGLSKRITLESLGKDQWRLEIGKSNEYGLYGQIVEVQAGKNYQLSANIKRSGFLHMPALRIEWLDAQYQVQPELLIEHEIGEVEDGLINMPLVEVPDNATFAVPTVYKDETEGTMSITSMFFREATCQ